MEIGSYKFGPLSFEDNSVWGTISLSETYTLEDNVYLMIYQIEQEDTWANIYVRGTGKVVGNSKNIQITNKGTVNSPGCTVYWALVQLFDKN